MSTITMPPPSSSSSSTTVVVEITIISIEGLNNYTSFFNPTIKPFITITKLSTTTTTPITTTLTWDHKFRITLDHSFFQDRYQCLYLQLFTKRRIMGLTQLGWCMIPALDIGLLPQGSVGYLSYRLRAKDGSRGQAVINLSVRLEGHGHDGHVHVSNVPWMSTSVSPTTDTRHTVIGIPITAVRGIDNDDYNTRN
ncbi:unnamed protein product [Lupinus luteus]|uniref:C2 domain-containing protein n=1 Tax=Lupinus luteus TaxID=3873 RepID=A0AAV1YAA5_LUPLU